MSLRHSLLVVTVLVLCGCIEGVQGAAVPPFVRRAVKRWEHLQAVQKGPAIDGKQPLLIIAEDEDGIDRKYTSSNTTGVKGNPPVLPDQWFTQKLDHFEPANMGATWQQRYWVDESHWNPALPGPIFIQLGEEAAMSSFYANGLQMANYGRQHGALLVCVEHRFYGKSAPLPDLSVESLRYLSVDQALADFAEIALWLRAQYNPNPSTPFASPIVVFGCSYIGAGAAWFRMKYPAVAAGAVASSAPVLAVVDFFKYLDQVDLSISEVFGKKCDTALQQGTNAVAQLLTTHAGVIQVGQMFNSCQPLNGSLDIATFWSNVIGNFMEIVQYANEAPSFNITTACDLVLAAASPLQGLVDYTLAVAGGVCTDNSYADMLAQMTSTVQPQAGVGVRSWTWQTCQEFGYFQTTDNSKQPFKKGNLVPLSYYIQICNDAFNGANFDNDTIYANIDETNIRFGGNVLPAYGLQNVVFDNSILDPWHTLSVQASVNPSVPLFLFGDEGHCAAVQPSSPTDPASIVAVRHKIAQIITDWVAE